MQGLKALGLGNSRSPGARTHWLPVQVRPHLCMLLNTGGQSLEGEVTASLCLGWGTTLAAPSGREHTCSAPPFQQTAPMESPGAHSLTGLPCLHRDCQESEGTPVACAFPRPSFLMAAPPSLSKRGASGPRPRPQLIGHEPLKGKRGGGGAPRPLADRILNVVCLRVPQGH